MSKRSERGIRFASKLAPGAPGTEAGELYLIRNELERHLPYQSQMLHELRLELAETNRLLQALLDKG